MTVSVVVVGRNDSYGYNIHKRIAISLNAIAEVLTHADDEIIFVDYNTVDTYPSILAVISDTLTEKTKRLTKVIRVRPSDCAKYFKENGISGGRGFDGAIARNLGIRYTNPKNKWILSTITDMVLVCDSLSDIIASLDVKQYYGIPRYSMPEMLWETMDRGESRVNILQIAKWAQEFNLQMISKNDNDFIGFTAPGDFQLIPRDVLFAIQGYNEGMIYYGYHDDSNLCKRVSLYLNRPVTSLQDSVAGYHCEHTRSAGEIHGASVVMNSWKHFVRNVQMPCIAEQKDIWGMQGYNLEIIPLSDINNHIGLIHAATSGLPHNDGMLYFKHNAILYNSKHATTFVLNEIQTLNLVEKKILYIGYNRSVYNGLLLYAPLLHAFFLDEKINISAVFQYDFVIYDYGFDSQTQDASIDHKMMSKLSAVFASIVRLCLKGKKLDWIIINPTANRFKYYEYLFDYNRKPVWNNIFRGTIKNGGVLKTLWRIVMSNAVKEYTPKKGIKNSTKVYKKMVILYHLMRYVIFARSK